MSEKSASQVNEQLVPEMATDGPTAERLPQIYLQVDTPRRQQPLRAGVPIPVTGWVSANEPIKEIIVSIGGTVSFATLGIHRPDLVEAFPEYPSLSHAGFSSLIQPPHLEPEAITELRVAARTQGGRERAIVFPLQFSEGTAGATLSDSQNAVDSEAAMILNVDQAVVARSGMMRIAGWVVAYAPMQSVGVYLDEELIGIAQIGLERTDVSQSWPNYPNALSSGFQFLADVSTLAGQRRLVVRAQTTTGILREAASLIKINQSVSPSRSHETHELVCDSSFLTTAGDLSITGWAVSSAGIEKLKLFFEDELIGEAEFGEDRPDVGNKFPAIAQARKSGFRFFGQVDQAKVKTEHIILIELSLSDGSSKEFKFALAARQPEQVLEFAKHDSGPSAIMLQIDDPVIINGSAAKEIVSGLSIGGWALARDGIEKIEIFLDGVRVGSAYYGMRREDIAATFSDWDGALLSGFAFSLPRKALKSGRQTVTIHALGKVSSEFKIEYFIDVSAGGELPGPWSLRTKIGTSELLVYEQLIRKFERRPHFSILLRTENGNTEQVSETLRSIGTQAYGEWSVAISCSSEQEASIREIISTKFANLTRRISVGFAGKTGMENETIPAEPRWVMVIEAGDKLAANTLFEFACEIGRDPTTEFIYGDERRVDPESQAAEAFFKPDWSPDLLLSCNYVGRAFCVLDAVLKRCQISSPEKIDNYDLVLRCTEQSKSISHIRQVLYESVAEATAKVEKRALSNAIKRRKLNVTVEGGRTKKTFRLRSRATPSDLVSIIIPTCAARGLIETCIRTLKEVSTYKNIEIICVDNILDPSDTWKEWLRENADVVVEISEPFNWSLFNNIAAREASGSFLLFLNDDIEIIQPDWLETLVEIAERSEVGVVGPQLLYPDGKVQHAGLFLSRLGTARHAFRFLEGEESGYFELALTQRNVIGVTGACMLMRREVFDRLGGFEESHAIINNDLDLCLKSHVAGLWNVFTPFATLIHHELASRAHIKDEHDSSAFNSEWEELFSAGDPFFHPNLSKDSDVYEFEAEPSCLVFSGHPLYRYRSIKNILAVKIDHIGDFITAFPAFRRIKQKFPDATLHVLAAPSAKHLASLEPSIDQIIPFEFFHARSGLGQKEIGDDELEGLRRELLPYEFDMAVDLRKHSDSRKLLLCSGAKCLAGFDHQNQFPWLDIAIQWEGDPRFVAKRQHVSDDLINLVDAIAAGGEQERGLAKRPDDWSMRQVPLVARLSGDGLYARPLVCIHPAAGTEMRQWPPVNFASLVNMLIKFEDVNIAVIGGPDELEIASEVVSLIKRQDRAISLVGKLKLEELPYFIESCALFVGNNSGPKHIAAALGVPTIGIHSGVVDPNEWGPLGEIALAIKRDVSCAPCYLAKREDCHRELACLVGLLPADVLSACRRLLRARHGVSILNNGGVNLN
jgi:O-antigen biosynthesis protein